jgi:hypothetical protein
MKAQPRPVPIPELGSAQPLPAFAEELAPEPVREASEAFAETLNRLDEARRVAREAAGDVGHAAITVTLDTYGHLMPGSEAEAAALAESYIAAQQERAEDAARASGSVHDDGVTGPRTGPRASVKA